MAFLARKGADTAGVAALIQAVADTRKAKQVCVSYISGTITLVAGTATITNAAIQPNSVVKLSNQVPGGTLGTGGYKAVPAAGSAVVTSISTALATNASDTSVLAYEVTTPLFHADATASAETGDYSVPAQTLLTVSAATAVDLPTSITLANNIRQALNLMMADATAHLIADVTNPVVTALAVDLPTTEALLNACQTAFNAHLTQAGVHVVNDTLNTNATAAATNLATSQTLANALKASVNLHLASAMYGESVQAIVN